MSSRFLTYLGVSMSQPAPMGFLLRDPLARVELPTGCEVEVLAFNVDLMWALVLNVVDGSVWRVPSEELSGRYPGS